MSEYTHDVFISYSDADQEWVRDQLLPRLERAGLKVILDDRDFPPGAPILDNITWAVESSRHTLLVLTPAWVESGWKAFEGYLVGIADPAGQKRKLIPLMRAPCAVPPRIAMLSAIDLTDEDTLDEQMARLLRGLVARAHIFICYKRHVEPDKNLARYLDAFLAAHGHTAFVDGSLRTGEAWLEEIDREIKASDFLIVLLSKESANSEMVQAEVRRAYEHRKLQSRPHTLPVRMAYEGLLPYTIDAFLDPLQYVVWQNEADNERVGYEILAAIQGRLPKRTPIQFASQGEMVKVSEDGQAVDDDTAIHSPLPAFDPRFLEEPGGTVTLRSKFYIKRDADEHLERQVSQPGTITTIRAARQTGKSSLLVRGMQYAREHGAQVIHFDLQQLDRERLQTPDVFLRCLAEYIVRKLRLDLDEVAKSWRDSLGSQEKITYLMEDYVLPESKVSIILAMDEVDRLLDTPFHSDFFALMRAWHNSAAFEDLWARLNIVMVISTEPFLLVSDLNQSPFNVGLSLYLEDFTGEQVRDLNRRHGVPVLEDDLSQLMALLGGHPYLTRKALYTMVADEMSLPELVRAAPTDQGPFGDHLRRYRWLLRDQPDLQEGLRQVVRQGRCVSEMAFYRLLRAGLVKGSGDVCRCRCDLYRMYFEDKL